MLVPGNPAAGYGVSEAWRQNPNPALVTSPAQQQRPQPSEEAGHRKNHRPTGALKERVGAGEGVPGKLPFLVLPLIKAALQVATPPLTSTLPTLPSRVQSHLLQNPAASEKEEEQ